MKNTKPYVCKGITKYLNIVIIQNPDSATGSGSGSRTIGVEVPPKGKIVFSVNYFCLKYLLGSLIMANYNEHYV